MARARSKAGMGELEAAVMEVLWSSSGWLTPAEVHETLAGQRPLAYNTVLTIIVRLWQKGRLRRQRDGRTYAYQATESREAWAAGRMEEVLAQVGDRSAVLGLLVGGLSSADRDQLRRMLAAADEPSRRRR